MLESRCPPHPVGDPLPVDPSPFDPSIWQPIHWAAIALAGAAGWGLGFVGTRRSARAARLRELEQELEEARRELASYRERVAGHFTETSKHLRDLALQYRTVYEHLADGARTLCPDAAVPIEAGLPSSLLSEGSASAAEPGSSAAPAPEDFAEPAATPPDPDPLQGMESPAAASAGDDEWPEADRATAPLPDSEGDQPVADETIDRRS